MATFGCFQGHLGSLWAYSGCLLGHFGEHWGALGCLGGSLGDPWPHFGGIWDRFRALLDPNIARSGPERHIADIPESSENRSVLLGFQGWRLLGCSSCVSGVQPGWLGWLAGLCWLAKLPGWSPRILRTWKMEGRLAIRGRTNNLPDSSLGTNNLPGSRMTRTSRTST